MTAADLRYGRGGGRHIPPNAILPGINDVPLVPAICAHGHRVLLAENDYETPPVIDGREVHRHTIANVVCAVDGHGFRRATSADDRRPVLVVAYVPSDLCPCGADRRQETP